MSDKSAIEWTDATWNPIVGCGPVSPGCTNCYAMKFAGTRLDGNPRTPHYASLTQHSAAGPVWNNKVALAPDHILTAPLRWKRPRRIFVNSMGDLFHKSVPDEWINRIFAVMELAHQHTFKILTKRSARMRYYITENPYSRYFDTPWPLPNVWLGISAEDQRYADERLADLLATPPAPDRLAARRCAAMPDDATYQACLERAARTIDRFRKAERGAR